MASGARCDARKREKRRDLFMLILLCTRGCCNCKVSRSDRPERPVRSFVSGCSRRRRRRGKKKRPGHKRPWAAAAAADSFNCSTARLFIFFFFFFVFFCVVDRHFTSRRRGNFAMVEAKEGKEGRNQWSRRNYFVVEKGESCGRGMHIKVKWPGKEDNNNVDDDDTTFRHVTARPGTSVGASIIYLKGSLHLFESSKWAVRPSVDSRWIDYCDIGTVGPLFSSLWRRIGDWINLLFESLQSSFEEKTPVAKIVSL